MTIPNPERVRTRADFIRFVALLRQSWDRAIAEPAPPPYVDLRGGWINWSGRDSFVEGTEAWLADAGLLEQFAREPIAAVVLGTPSLGETDDLGQYLATLQQWAEAHTDDGSEAMWKLAAEALAAGSNYE
jgi:hypothetical protein